MEVILKRLSFAIAEKDVREQLEDSEFIERYYQETFGKKEKEIVEKEKEIAELKGVMTLKEKELEQKEKALEEVNQRAEQEKQRAEQEKVMIAKRLLNSGMTVGIVMDLLQVTEDFLKTNGLIE